MPGLGWVGLRLLSGVLASERAGVPQRERGRWGGQAGGCCSRAMWGACGLFLAGLWADLQALKT